MKSERIHITLENTALGLQRIVCLLTRSRVEIDKMTYNGAEKKELALDITTNPATLYRIVSQIQRFPDIAHAEVVSRS